VHLQGEDELQAREVAELLGDRRVARAGLQHPERRRERVHAGGGSPQLAPDGFGQPQPRCRQPSRGRAGRRDGRELDLHLRRRQLALEARVGAERGQHLLRAWRKVERPRVEEHHLLLHADRQRRGDVEQLPQVGPGAHGADIMARHSPRP
jgi:hypothetical protein